MPHHVLRQHPRELSPAFDWRLPRRTCPWRGPIPALVLGLALLSSPSARSQPSAIGNNQPVAVIATRYRGTEIPPFTAADWAAAMNDRVNAHYTVATAGQTTFAFVPLPDIIQFPYTYEETTPPEVAGLDIRNDPAVITREIHDAIAAVLTDAPNALDGIERVVVILNRPKRARATGTFPFVGLGPAYPLYLASACILVDPFADDRLSRGQFNFNPGVNDLDGDGLLDNDEATAGTDPEDPDSDGDGLSDRFEVDEGLDPNEPDTDGDGFDDWEERLLRSDGIDANATPILPDRQISTAVHEIGHQLGLPDLYRADYGGTPEPYEYWGTMAVDNLQQFSAFSRVVAGWRSPELGVENVGIPPTGLDPTTYILTPPGIAQIGNTEILSIRRANFAEVLVEARPTQSVDEARPAVLYNRTGSSGLPSTYEPGLLVTQTDLRYQDEGDFLRFITGAPLTKVLPQYGPGDCSPETGMLSALEGTLQGPALLQWDHALVANTDDFLEIHLDGVLMDVIDETLDADGRTEYQAQEPGILVPEGTHVVTITHRNPPGAVWGDAFLANFRLIRPPAIAHDPDDVSRFVGQPASLAVLLQPSTLPGAEYQWERRVGGIWQPIPGATNQNFSWPFIPAAAAGLYRVRVSNEAGATLSEAAEVSVFDPGAHPLASALDHPGREFTSSSITYPWIPNPTGNAVQTAPALPPDTPVSLTTVVEGPAEVSFTWLRTHTATTFQCFVGDSLVASHLVTGVEAARFQVGAGPQNLRWTFSRPTTSGGGIIQDLEIVPAPRIWRSPEDLVIRAGEAGALSLVLNVGNTNDLTFRWYRDNTLIDANGGLVLNLTNASAADQGVYHAEVLTPFGTVETLDAEVSVVTPEEGAAPFLLNRPGASWSTSGCLETWHSFRETELRSPFPGSYFFSAAIEIGDTFVDDAGLTIEALPLESVANPAAYPEGSIAVRVSSPPPPGMADIRVVQGWLDNPGNGFGTFFLGTGGIYNDPNFHGDGVYTQLTPSVNTSVFPPAFSLSQSTFTHRVEFRVVNLGDATAHGVSGRMYFLPMITPAGLVTSSRFALEQLATESVPINLGDLEPGEAAVARGLFEPEGPFNAVLLLDPVENEPNNANNSLLAPFFLVTPSFGSPYEEVDVPLDVENLNPEGVIILPQVRNLPDGWTTEFLDPANDQPKTSDILAPGDSSSFRVRIQAPDPVEDPRYKPGLVADVRVQGWMNLRDTYVPFGEVPVVVVLTHPTRLQLDVKETPPQAVLSGRLTYRPQGSATFDPLSERPVRISVTGSDGVVRTFTVVTAANGTFDLVIDAPAGLSYAAIAQFQGDAQNDRSESPMIRWGTAKENALQDFDLNRSSFRENIGVGSVVGDFRAPKFTGKVAFELVPGQGDIDNFRFKIDDPQLLTADRFDHEDRSILSLRARARDLDNGTVLEKVFVLAVLNDAAEDKDRDGLTEEQERRAGTSDSRPDSDGDGVSDDIEVGLGTDPTSFEDQPVSAWVSVRGIRFEGPMSAHYGARGEIIATRHGTRDDGVYLIPRDGSARRLADLKEPTTVALTPGGDALAAQASVPAAFLLDLDDRSGTAWLTGVLKDGAAPFGVDFVPGTAVVPPAKAGQGLVAGYGPKVSGVWQFSPGVRDESARIDDAKRADIGAVDVTLAGNQIFVAGTAGNGLKAGVYRLAADGRFIPLPSSLPLRDARAITSDGHGRNLFVADQARGDSRILQIDPFTGQARTAVSGLSDDLGYAGLDYDPSAERLLVTDHGSEVIHEFSRAFGRAPRLDAVDPEAAVAGGSLLLSGEFLSEATAVTVGGQPVASFEVQDDRRLKAQLPSGAPAGFVQVTTPFGVTTSPRPLQILGPIPTLELDPAAIAENLPAGTVVGRLATPVPAPVAFEFIPGASYPDNRAFRLVDNRLVSAFSYDYEDQQAFLLGIRAFDAAGQIREQEFTVTILNRPEILSQPQSLTVAAGEDAEFHLEVEESDDLEIQWLRDGTPIFGATQADLSLDAVGTDAAGTYTALVSTALESLPSRSATLTVTAPDPTVSVTAGEVIDNTLVFTADGASSGVYLLEASNDLRRWSEVQRLPARNGPVEFAERLDADRDGRFYRIRWRP